MSTPTGPLKSYDVYLCWNFLPYQDELSRRPALKPGWVAVERGPFDPRREPAGDYHSVQCLGTFPGYSEDDAINTARQRGRARRD